MTFSARSWSGCEGSSFGADGELQDIAGIQVQIGFEVARANGGTLGVEQQPNRLAHLFCELSNSRHNLTHPGVLGMAHV